MGLPRRVLLRSLTSRELAEWQAYEQLEPLGGQGADLRLAYLLLFLTAKKNGDSFTLQELLPPWAQDDTTTSQSDSLSVEALNALFGGKDTR